MLAVFSEESVALTPPSWRSAPLAASSCTAFIASATWPRKMRALASQVIPSAKARHSSREHSSASRQARCKSSSSTPTGAAPITSRGAAAGKAATGTPLASASSSTSPKVSVRLGNTNTSAAE